MENDKRSLKRKKILEGLDKVYEKLIAFKIKMNSELVVLKEGKIVRIKPTETNQIIIG